MMYKKANKFNQTNNLGLADLCNFTKFEDLTAKEQRENFVLIYKKLCQISLGKLTKDERRELGMYQQETQNKINAIRPKINNAPTTRDHFIDAAKERLPKYLYIEIMDEASNRAKEGRLALPVSIAEKIASLIEC